VTVSAVLTLLLVAGCSKRADLSADVRGAFDSVRKTVRQQAGVPERADSMLAVLDTVEQRSLVLVQAARDENARLLVMFADRNVDDAALLAEFRAAERQRAQLRLRVLESRGRLKTMATPEEWSAIARAENKAMHELAALVRGK
jgi:hypothetical protein